LSVHAPGVATLAAFGLSFFEWNDQADAKANLAELKAYREAIAAEGHIVAKLVNNCPCYPAFAW
jgi:hypothetical protein